MQIAKNRVVAFDYTLTDGGGNVLESSEGREPLQYIHGTGHLISALESALEGGNPGDHIDVSLEPAAAYGERDERLVFQVPRSQFQDFENLEVGMRFRARTASGEQVFTIAAIEGDDITVDGNHPLAGETLHFSIDIREVREATDEELEHGHVH